MSRKPLNIPKELLYQKYIVEELNLSSVAKNFKTDRSTIKRYLELYNIPIRICTNSKPTIWLQDLNITKDFLYQKYIIERLPINAISKELGINRYFIRQLLKQYNIPTRGKNSSYRYGFNENFFEIPNITNSYWAGFIAADGCVIDSSKNHRLQITLHNKDHNHLETFKNNISYSGPILVRYRKNTSKLSRLKSKGYYISNITISSNLLSAHLQQNFNITPRKSLTLQPPNITDTDCVIAFIAGYIDGDGSISIDKEHPRMSILGTYDLLSWISYNLSLTFNLKNDLKVHKRQGEKSEYYSISSGRKEFILEFYEYLKRLKLPVLDRKWKKLENYVKHCTDNKQCHL